MSLTDDLLIELEAEADQIENNIQNGGGNYLSFLADAGLVDTEKLAEAQEYIDMAKAKLQEAEDALNEDPPNDAKYRRKAKIAKELIDKAMEKLKEAVGVK